MSEEFKGFALVVGAIVLIILVLTLNNLIFNIVAVKNGLHEQQSSANSSGFIWVK